jgi:DHA1 family inner membrane transport protein
MLARRLAHSVDVMDHRRLAGSLFLSFFTVQASFVVLSPTLTQVADDFDVSVGTTGQLRSVAAIAGLAAAPLIPLLGKRLGIARTLRGGLLLLAAGALLSAVAPALAMLAAAQVVIGFGSTAVLAAGLAAAAEWSEPDRRADVLAWAIIGQPAAWVAALPVIGRLADIGWRWTWLVVPVIAAVALAGLPRVRVARTAAAPATSPGGAWKIPGIRGWAMGEVMAYAGWGGTLTYAGALLSESYDIGAGSVAILLAGGAITYFPGAFAARRRLDGDLRVMLAGLALVLAVGDAIFGAVRVSPALSTVIFAALVLLAGARGIASGAFGLEAAPSHRVAVGSIRSGAGQLGYLAGAAAGGLALEVGGYAAVGGVLAGFFILAALPHLASCLVRKEIALLVLRNRPDAVCGDVAPV